jgi:hypothetical protein
MRRATAPLLVRGGQPGAAVELAWCSAIYPGELQNTRRRPVRTLPFKSVSAQAWTVGENDKVKQ